MSFSSPPPSLTPSRSPSPQTPTQPDHFYGSEDIQFPPSPNSDNKPWLDPHDDPFAHRGIPVFKPTMEEFRDFEAYVTKIECWGNRSGIVKVIPPEEWTDALPLLKEQLAEVKIRTPIEQHMLGRGGLFRQENMEKRKVMSVREWADLCAKEDFRAPGVHEISVHARSANGLLKAGRKIGKKKSNVVKSECEASSSVKQEPADAVILGFGDESNDVTTMPTGHVATPKSPSPQAANVDPVSSEASEPKTKARRRPAPKKEDREAALAERLAQDLKFLETFEPHLDWLPPGTTAGDYTREFCQALERRYWRNCGLGRPAWYGADTQGSLYTDATTSWNVAHLPSALSRLLPASNQGLPGVNTPYLYFGMWRATFAWHVEDMDLFSINYIHFGAPKFWYAIPQARAGALEQTMRGYFPKDTSNCPQFLRHKSFLASPTLLAQSSCRPNYLVQRSGEFVITFPRGYHAGFNLGFNCAESVNFALNSWLELGRVAKACECVPDSVRINVDQLLRDREAEDAAAANLDTVIPILKIRRSSSKKDNISEELKKEDGSVNTKVPKSSRKRKSEGGEEPTSKKLKIKVVPSKMAVSATSPSKAPLPKLSLKLGPKPPEVEPYPCCLCVSMDRQGLLRVYEPPIGRKDVEEAVGNPKEWLAHEFCAGVVPETWVDEIENSDTTLKEKVVFGVDAIVRDRWSLKCSACSKYRSKVHGAPIQCTKGKCHKAFHVSCAKDGAQQGILFTVVHEVEKEVILVEPATTALQMMVDPLSQLSTDPSDSARPADSRVLKVIKKYEHQALCSQHNPAVAAAKKASKMDRIKTELLSYPVMARIKIRVSAGVFEVSLIRVIEETGSVEVLWDQGVTREFKWGSVVFGNTDGPVQQRPSEMAPSPVRNGLPVQTFASVNAATASAQRSHAESQSQTTTNVTVGQRYGGQAQYSYGQQTNSYDVWYQNCQGNQAPPYMYYGYQANAQVPQYGPYAHPQYTYQQVQWQQAYQGQTAGQRPQPAPQSPSHPNTKDPSSEQVSKQGESSVPQDCSKEQVLASATQAASSTTLALTHSSSQSQTAYPNLAALLTMSPDQITELLKQNSQLRDLVIAAVTEAQKAVAPS